MDACTRAAKKILVVEDEPTLADNIGAYLAAQGYEVRVVYRGREALAECAAFAPDQMILDYSLPDMNGFEVFDAMCKSGCCCCCVLMTAHPHEVVAQDAAARGIEHILFKPFALAELARVLGTLGCARQ